MTPASGPEAREGGRFAVLDVVDSTNLEAKRRLRRGDRRLGWIAARRQLDGRGRNGRGWSTEVGNLAATLTGPMPVGGPARAATLALVGGLAACRMLAVGCGLSPRLKWPNDVLAEGRKIAGVLLESLEDAVIVGIGVNLGHAPRVTDGLAATSVRELTGAAPDFEAALAQLDDAWRHWRAVWELDFAAVRGAWLARAAFLGESVRARVSGAEHHGVFEGLAEDGALLLRTGEGLRRLPSAEVFGT